MSAQPVGYTAPLASMPRGARQPPTSATQPRRLSGRRGLQAALLTVAEGPVRVNLDTNFPRPLCLIFAEKTERWKPSLMQSRMYSITTLKLYRAFINRSGLEHVMSIP